MKSACCLALFIGIGLAGCRQKEAATTAAQTNQPPGTGNPITAPVDYLGAVGKAKKFAGKTVDLAALNQAIQLFHTSEDRFPNDLNELVSEGYLPRLPAPPPGMRVSYSSARGEVRFLKQ